MTKSTITREENVQAVFDLKAGYTLGLADVEILKRVARMALAAIDSEPVAYMYRDNLHSDARFSLESKIGNWSPEDINEHEISETPLYRHAQQPVVPRVTCWSCRNQVEISAIGGCDGYCPECDAPIDLGEEPYTSEQPVPVVPDIDELRLAFEAAERESVDGFNLHKYGIGYADDETQGRWDTWLACLAAMLQESQKSAGESNNCRSCENVQDLQAGNSPVIPEGYVMVPKEPTPEMLAVINEAIKSMRGSAATYARVLAAAPHDTPALNSLQSVDSVAGKWIPVSERIPEDDDFVYIWPRPDFGVDLHVGQYCERSPKGEGWYAQVYEQNYGIEWFPINVTHWMPLPAGPREEK
ncbi:DUF551 domain-containing protein [Klebsiella michiganensis]|uniref:DUF551 domain-containing protein n=1 Tax=Klebsiella michiganensis TaxID=1134687 RepID=UPI001D0F359C|nr:DUF551 domain-containing protein [Klebsiella michiganensis]